MTRDISTKFGIDNCGVLVTNRGKEVECYGTELENDEEISQIGDEEYKYLCAFEKEDICQEEMKENIRKKHFKRALY